MLVVLFPILILFVRYTDSPDIIYIVESWLSPDILDSELTIPKYLSFRLDRSRVSTRRLIIIYVKSSPNVTPIPH